MVVGARAALPSKYGDARRPRSSSPTAPHSPSSPRHRRPLTLVVAAAGTVRSQLPERTPEDLRRAAAAERPRLGPGDTPRRRRAAAEEQGLSARHRRLPRRQERPPARPRRLLGRVPQRHRQALPRPGARPPDDADLAPGQRVTLFGEIVDAAGNAVTDFEVQDEVELAARPAGRRRRAAAPGRRQPRRRRHRHARPGALAGGAAARRARRSTPRPSRCRGPSSRSTSTRSPRRSGPTTPSASAACGWRRAATAPSAPPTRRGSSSSRACRQRPGAAPALARRLLVAMPKAGSRRAVSRGGLTPAALRGFAGQWGLGIPLPVASLPPGEYQATLEVTEKAAAPPRPRCRLHRGGPAAQSAPELSSLRQARDDVRLSLRGAQRRSSSPRAAAALSAPVARTAGRAAASRPRGTRRADFSATSRSAKNGHVHAVEDARGARATARRRCRPGTPPRRRRG